MAAVAVVTYYIVKVVSCSHLGTWCPYHETPRGESEQHMKWFAVLSVLRHRSMSNSEATYEERIMLHFEETAEAALAHAKTDSDVYLEDNPSFVAIGRMSVFALGAEGLDLTGAEVWSCLHRGLGDADRFWSDRYEKYSMLAQ